MARSKPRLVAQQPAATGAGDCLSALDRRVQSLSGLIDAVRDPMMLLRRDGALLWVNSAACDQLGRRRDDLLMQPLHSFASGYGDLAPTVNILRLTSHPRKPLAAEFARADGSNWAVELRASKITFGGETAVLMLLADRGECATNGSARSSGVWDDFPGEAALAAISSRLVQATNDDLDAPIRVSLAELCQTLSADSGELLLLDSHGAAWTSSLHWSATHSLRPLQRLEPIPTEQLGWTSAQLCKLDSVVIQDVDCMPLKAVADRKALKAAGFSSAVFAPLVHGGQILGCLVLGRTSVRPLWHDGETELIRSVADLFATSLERQRIQIEMSGRLQFESLVGSIASSLLRTPGNLLDPGIEEALHRLAEYLRADHAAVVLLSGDGQRFGISHEVCAPTSRHARETVQDLSVDGFLPLGRNLLPTDVASIPDVHALSGAAEESRRLLTLFGIGSALAVPMVFGAEVVGGIVIGRTTSGHIWDKRQVALLRASADIIITIIQRMRIEQALRESDEKFSRTFLAMPDAVAISEIDTGRIIEANPAFETGLDLPLSQALGRSALETGFWGSEAEHQQLVEDVLRYGVVRNRELAIRRSNGETVNILLSAVKIELRGKPYLCTVLRDVTAAKTAEQALRAAESALRDLNLELEARVKSRTAELETSLRELESFSYSVSHDLRSPLRGINGFASLLAEEYADRLDDNARDYLFRISSATVRMGNLIDELLDLARIARVPMRKTRIDLAPIARSIVSEFRESEPQREIEIVIAPQLAVRADLGLMHVVLSNLLGNAWKFTCGKRRPKIELGSRSVDGEQQFFVRDNGAGFDMANSQLLFRPFSRLHRPTEFPGTGIGLATVARIVERHGGRIWAEGQVGDGAGFYFTLR